ADAVAVRGLERDRSLPDEGLPAVRSRAPRRGITHGDRALPTGWYGDTVSPLVGSASRERSRVAAALRRRVVRAELREAGDPEHDECATGQESERGGHL